MRRRFDIDTMNYLDADGCFCKPQIAAAAPAEPYLLITSFSINRRIPKTSQARNLSDTHTFVVPAQAGSQ